MKYVWLALFLLGCTLVPALMVWAIEGRRRAVEAWKQFALFLGVPLLIGGCTWVGWLIFPPVV